MEVKTTLSLAQLQDARKGFIVNVRHDRIKLHRAGCEAVSAMVTAAYPKYYSETVEEAVMFLALEYGPNDWENCGKCGGARGATTF